MKCKSCTHDIILVNGKYEHEECVGDECNQTYGCDCTNAAPEVDCKHLDDYEFRLFKSLIDVGDFGNKFIAGWNLLSKRFRFCPFCGDELK